MRKEAWGRTHLVDPVDVGRHTGEDRWLFEGVAAQPGAKADDASHVPVAVLGLAVQGGRPSPPAADGVDVRRRLGPRFAGGQWSEWGK